MVIAGVVALVALATVVASLGYAHLEPTGLSPVRNAVSQYGISPARSDYRVATLAFAAAGIALAVAFSQAIDHRAALISWFPMDAPGSERTATGQLHGMLAIAAFGSATIAAFRLALPRAVLRYAGGRELTLGDLGTEAGMLGGINAIVVGNYLTTLGRPAQQDLDMLTRLQMPIKALSATL